MHVRCWSCMLLHCLCVKSSLSCICPFRTRSRTQSRVRDCADRPGKVWYFKLALGCHTLLTAPVDVAADAILPQGVPRDAGRCRSQRDQVRPLSIYAQAIHLPTKVRCSMDTVSLDYYLRTSILIESPPSARRTVWGEIVCFPCSTSSFECTRFPAVRWCLLSVATVQCK